MLKNDNKVLPHIFDQDKYDLPKSGYLSPEPIKTDKIERNAPCPCGSGKKYKKCCGS
ncbi:MAG: SEC-C domain-containing protein [Verrucomicrobia bacterium]|nr:SEC-C domain-containing protein [Prolixibacteraceae bacterium]